MDYNVNNMASLKAALESGFPDKLIKITASFTVNETLICHAGNISISSNLSDKPVLKREVGFTGNMFEVQNGADLYIGQVVLDGNVQVVGAVNGSLIYNNGGTIYIEDTTLKNNNNTLEGGAILNRAGHITTSGAIFDNNHSELNGGAVSSEADFVPSSTTFTNNTAKLNGGALYYTNPSSPFLSNSCSYDRNTALNGGALYLNGGNIPEVDYSIVGVTAFTANIASQDGGAIWVNNLNKLTVLDTTTFANNRAAQGYIINDPVDIQLHNSQIHATVFTTPFQFGYNNFDIVYTNGIPYVDGDCDVVGTQTVDICVPVTVTPSAVAGPIVVKCCGSAVITPGTNICPGSPNPDCSFTISQRLCIEVPVEFDADANVGQTHVTCSTVSNNRACLSCADQINENENDNDNGGEEISPDE